MIPLNITDKERADLDGMRDAICAIMRQAGVSYAIAEYDGSGDDGSVHKITLYGADCQPMNVIESPMVTFPGEEEGYGLWEACREFAYRALTQHYAGWQNDEGASGDVTIDAVGWALIHHSMRSIVETGEELEIGTPFDERMKAPITPPHAHRKIEPMKNHYYDYIDHRCTAVLDAMDHNDVKTWRWLVNLDPKQPNAALKVTGDRAFSKAGNFIAYPLDFIVFHKASDMEEALMPANATLVIGTLVIDICNHWFDDRTMALGLEGSVVFDSENWSVAIWLDGHRAERATVDNVLRPPPAVRAAPEPAPAPTEPAPTVPEPAPAAPAPAALPFAFPYVPEAMAKAKDAIVAHMRRIGGTKAVGSIRRNLDDEIGYNFLGVQNTGTFIGLDPHDKLDMPIVTLTGWTRRSSMNFEEAFEHLMLMILDAIDVENEAHTIEGDVTVDSVKGIVIVDMKKTVEKITPACGSF
jgi:hypothetical protein